MKILEISQKSRWNTRCVAQDAKIQKYILITFRLHIDSNMFICGIDNKHEASHFLWRVILVKVTTGANSSKFSIILSILTLWYTITQYHWFRIKLIVFSSISMFQTDMKVFKFHLMHKIFLAIRWLNTLSGSVSVAKWLDLCRCLDFLKADKSSDFPLCANSFKFLLWPCYFLAWVKWKVIQNRIKNNS